VSWLDKKIYTQVRSPPINLSNAYIVVLAATMKAFISILFCLIAIVACRTKRDHPSIGNDDCLPYFKYDRIVHYRIAIENDLVGEIWEKKSRSDSEERLFSILSDKYHDEKYAMTSLQDTARMRDLEKLGFGKQEIFKDEYDIFDTLFCERPHDEVEINGIHYEEIEVNMCLPVYRDILFFKDHGKTVGFARICLDCDMSNIVGSMQMTDNFGQVGEFDVLTDLLK